MLANEFSKLEDSGDDDGMDAVVGGVDINQLNDIPLAIELDKYSDDGNFQARIIKFTKHQQQLQSRRTQRLTPLILLLPRVQILSQSSSTPQILLLPPVQLRALRPSKRNHGKLLEMTLPEFFKISVFTLLL
jgi:hypothetical protein